MKAKKVLKIIGILIIVFGLVALIFYLSYHQLPVRVITEYPFDKLWEEGITMHECAECHDPKTEFHVCSTCHDEHGSIELPNLSFYTMVELTGDVPEVVFIPTNHFFNSYTVLPNTFLTVDDFMAKWGIASYESITFYTHDGNYVTVNKSEITKNAKFLPYEDGIRFASEDLHGSAWPKGIARIIIVGSEKPLQIGNEYTSFGRLLLGKTTSLTVEEAKVMFRSTEDSITRTAITATRIEGAALNDLIDLSRYKNVIFTLQNSSLVVLPASEVKDAVLTKQKASLVLVIPGKGRNKWLFGIAKIEGEE